MLGMIIFMLPSKDSIDIQFIFKNEMSLGLLETKTGYIYCTCD